MVEITTMKYTKVSKILSASYSNLFMYLYERKNLWGLFIKKGEINTLKNNISGLDMSVFY